MNPQNRHAAPAASLRLAATVMIVRDAPFEVLMVKRNARPPFASALVFPGGVLEPDDYSHLWLEHIVPIDYGSGERALRIAACRETWEETGLLICADEQVRPVRGSDQESFLDVVLRHRQTLDLSRLLLFAHWITPETYPKRFDTYFYLCRAPQAQTGICDGLETIDLEWLEPEEGLSRAASGDSSILFPTQKNLELLATAKDAEAALESARNRRIVTVMPILGDAG